MLISFRAIQSGVLIHKRVKVSQKTRSTRGGNVIRLNSHNCQVVYDQWDFREVRRPLSSAQIYLFGRAVNLKYCLCQIDANCRNLNVGRYREAKLGSP